MKKTLWAAVAMDNLDGIREILNEGSSDLNDDQVLSYHFSGSALELCLYEQNNRGGSIFLSGVLLSRENRRF